MAETVELFLLTVLLFVSYNLPVNNILSFVVTYTTGTLCRRPNPLYFQQESILIMFFKPAFYSKDPQHAGNFTQTTTAGHYYFSLREKKNG